MQEIYKKAQKIKCVIFDVDGVLTDGRLHFNEAGELSLSFYIHDGLGIELLHRAGITPAIISGRKGGAIEARAKQLRIQHLYLGYADKLKAYEEIRQHLQLQTEEMAYVGDDWVDLKVMQQVGLKIAVANATEEVKNMADWITPNKGGKGAVRDVCELIIKSQDRYDELMAYYL